MNNKLDMWIMQKVRYFPTEDFMSIQGTLEKLPEAKTNMLYLIPLKNPTTFLLVSIFLSIWC